MKILCFFKSFMIVTAVAVTFSCSKDTGYEASYPITGNWVLKYADGGNTNAHIDYPLDGSTPFPGGSTIISWASHLVLKGNDSAYWNSAGYDANPVFFAKGYYSLSANNHPAIELSFTIGDFSAGPNSKFEYSFQGKDTLVLNDLSDNPVFYTYVRK